MHSTSHLQRDNTNTTVHKDKIIVNSHATRDINKDLTTNQRRQLFFYHRYTLQYNDHFSIQIKTNILNKPGEFITYFMLPISLVLCWLYI